MSKSNLARTFIFSIFTLPYVLLFQNCAVEGTTESALSQRDLATIKSETVDSYDNYQDEEHVTTYKERTEVNPIVSNRVYAVRIFESIFGKNQKYFYNLRAGYAPSDFGSGMSMYNKVISSSKDCIKNADPLVLCRNTEVPQSSNEILGLNPRREALRMQMCAQATKNKSSMDHALLKIGKSKAPAINESHLNRAYSLFNRGEVSAPAEILDALIIVSQDQNTNRKKWQSVLNTICLSPHWQVL